MAIRYYVSTEEASFFNNNRMGYANNIPTEGNYKVGDFIISSTQENGVFGWVCTVAGNPGEWEVIGSGAAGGNKVVGYVNAVSFSNTRNSIEIGIDEYEKGKDFLEVHYNGLLLAEGVHYNVNADGKSITAIDAVWNENADDTQQMIFRVLKSEGVNVKELKNTIDINYACYEVETGISVNPDKDIIEVHLNGVMLIQGVDYEVVGGKITKLDRSEAWNPYNVNGQKMFIRVLRNNASVIEPIDGSVTINKLSDDIKEDLAAIDGLIASVDIQNTTISNINDRVGAIESGGGMSGKQDKTDNSLATTDKTIVGAINELFQSANNGKQLIANAIGEPLDSNDTFSAMSDKINDMKSDLKQVLTDEGVSVTEEDDMASLIGKVDSEFNDKKQELINVLNNKGIDASTDESYDELLNKFNRFLMIYGDTNVLYSDTTSMNCYVKDGVSETRSYIITKPDDERSYDCINLLISINISVTESSGNGYIKHLRNGELINTYSNHYSYTSATNLHTLTDVKFGDEIQYYMKGAGSSNTARMYFNSLYIKYDIIEI